MSPPTSAHFTVQAIPDAGRGVLASQDIPSGRAVLDSGPGAAHVIFREYRKEVCAHCFAYDRGRTLPVRDSGTGKVFCDQQCRNEWLVDQGDLGREAWEALYVFVQAKSKAIMKSLLPITTKPEQKQIDRAWAKAESQAQLHVQLQRSSTTPSSKGTSFAKSMSQAWAKHVDPDVLGYLLSGILQFHQHPTTWESQVSCLAADDEPYKSTEELQSHCDSFVQLSAVVPLAILSSCTPSTCQVLASAGSHNAFGIRSGSADGEEYMGYGIWPSASYFNHTCNPNIVKERVGNAWEFRTARNVEEGDELCITYLGGDEKDLTVWERRARLAEVWNFECMCERCVREADSCPSQSLLSFASS